MARFIFDCEDEICLPAAYKLVDEVKPYVDKIKNIQVDDKAKEQSRTVILKKVLENMMVKYPGETSKILAKLWVLEENEKAPNVFKTMSALFSSEVAVDFFTSVLPSLLKTLSQVSPMLNLQK